MAIQVPKALRQALEDAASEAGISTTEYILDTLIHATQDRLGAKLLDAHQAHLESR
jgi:hypothetical protein